MASAAALAFVFGAMFLAGAAPAAYADEPAGTEASAPGVKSWSLLVYYDGDEYPTNGLHVADGAVLANALPTPDLDGRKFSYWSLDKAGTIRFDAAVTPVHSDLVLFAQYGKQPPAETADSNPDYQKALSDAVSSDESGSADSTAKKPATDGPDSTDGKNGDGHGKAEDAKKTNPVMAPVMAVARFSAGVREKVGDFWFYCIGFGTVFVLVVLAALVVRHRRGMADDAATDDEDDGHGSPDNGNGGDGQANDGHDPDDDVPARRDADGGTTNDHHAPRNGTAGARRGNGAARRFGVPSYAGARHNRQPRAYLDEDRSTSYGYDRSLDGDESPRSPR